MFRNSNGGNSNRPRTQGLSKSLGSALVFFAFATAAFADDSLRDRVALRVKGRRTPLTLYGTIVEYNGRTLSIRTAAGMLRSYPAEDVLEVKTPQSEAHVRGLLAFSKAEYLTARRLLKTALADEPRAWVKRELMALLVRCALRSGERTEAVEQFLSLVESDPSTQHFHLIPLAWAPEKLDAATKAVAQGRLLGSKSAAKLIAASQLLFDPRWEQSAETALKNLRSDIDTRISRLAEIQLWRKTLAAGVPSADTVADWRKTIGRLPVNSRGGPYYVLGRAHLQRKENEQAAAALLWLPLVYDDDRRLAAGACFEAADALQDVGKTHEAITLFREVRTRFSETEFAREAAAQLARYAKSAGKR